MGQYVVLVALILVCAIGAVAVRRAAAGLH
jgi:hypothetical protein